MELQKSLNESGFAFQTIGEPLDEDGIYGPNTDHVYRAWLDRDTSVPTVSPTPAKPWWTSRAILGLSATIIAMIAGQFGFEVENEQITQVLLQAVELGGLIVATWGTIRRKGQIDPTLVARVGSKEVRLPTKTQTQQNEDPRGSFKDF
ncbi:hypothetical protein EOM86_08195 [Candidatus Nomurabacteria bacterium]|nr:hypothetical protein [Candidatus Nomurabacteria bacterium]